MSATSGNAYEDEGMEGYCREGARKAMVLGNRGPVRFTADGKLHPAILDAYRRCGFYVFEGVISADELSEMEAEAKKRGADAIVGVDLDYETVSQGTMLMVTASGTAVKL